MKEIGRAIQTIPAFTSSINYHEVKLAMETISAQAVIKWQKDNIGQSPFSKRENRMGKKSKICYEEF